jgi:hypothetical protein
LVGEDSRELAREGNEIGLTFEVHESMLYCRFSRG